MCPGNNITGGETPLRPDPHRQPRTARTECAWAAARTRGTYLSAQYWRLARRIGNKKAAIAVGHSILVIAGHLLTNDTDYDELGGDDFLRRHDNPTHQRDRHVKALRELGYQVTLAEAG